MPLRHHPSAQVRADYTTANLSPGASLAVAVHLQFCTICMIAVQALDGFPQQQAPIAPEVEAHDGVDDRLPPALQAIRREPWRSIQAKVRGARLQGVSGLGEAAWLIEAAPGARLVLSRPQGIWGVVFLHGEARNGELRYGPGDFLDAHERPLTRPQIDSKVLLLVVAHEAWGRRRLERLLQRLPLARR